MIISTHGGQSFDTDTDLTSEERHVLQKLYAWEALATSISQFREKKTDALLKGWNNSGPIAESPTLKLITDDMEKKITSRLRGSID